MVRRNRFRARFGKAKNGEHAWRIVLSSAFVKSRRLAQLLVAVVVIAGGSAQAGTRCDGGAAAKALGLAAREWQVACWQVDDGRQVIAAVPLAPLPSAAEILKPHTPKDGKTPPQPPLVIKLALARDAIILWRGEVRPDAKTSPELKEVLERSEEWLVGIDDVNLGRERGVRVGVVGHWGEEVMSVREIALLFRLPAADGVAPRLLWSGLGNTRESRLDYCLIEGIATFTLVDDKTLERQMRLTANVNRDTKLGRSKARALEKKCAVEPQEPKRFPIAP
jgi:hypothetical protein